MIQCDLCSHQCSLKEGQTGFCNGRIHHNGVISSSNYGKITSLCLDPMEKKPLYHFYPGTKILSVGSFGCNLRCPFCQNHEISMKSLGEVYYQNYKPEELVQHAKDLENQGNIGLAYTYNEPCIGYEFVMDTARLVHEKQMKNVLVTNGCFSLSLAEKVLPLMDACNIDLKSASHDFYQNIGGDLEMVKEFIGCAYACSHVELTTLLIPGENDSLEEMEELVDFIAGIDRKIPYHISRFFPCYHMLDREPTNVSLVYERVAQAKNKLQHVYPGNC